MPAFRRSFARLCVCLCACLLSPAAGAAEPAGKPASPPPNILLLLADDLGWVDLGTDRTNRGNGSGYHQTPNIDRLAAEGMSFDSGYAYQNCKPSRATLHSGQAPVRHWVYTAGGFEDVPAAERKRLRIAPPSGRRSDLAPSTLAIGELLQQTGYRTAVLGKVHGMGRIQDLGENHGFDVNLALSKQVSRPGSKRKQHYFAVRAGDGSWHFSRKVFDRYAAPYTAEYVEKNLVPVANGNDPKLLIGTPKHLTDAIADAALDLIGREAARPEPFFIEVAFHAVHEQIRPRPDLRAKYDSRSAQELRHGRPAYAALVEGLDQSVGRILAGLDDPNGDGDESDSIRSNTLVVFLSDNGGVTSQTSNAPLRGGKGSFHEGGLRVPWIVRMPGTVAAGAISDEAVGVADLYPTFAELAGAAIPPRLARQLDGESLLPLLRGQRTRLERQSLFWHFPGYSDVRVTPLSIVTRRHAGKRYKLVWSYQTESYALYDLDDDLGEQRDLLAGGKATAAQREAAARLSVDLNGWIRALRAPLGWVRRTNTRLAPPPVLEGNATNR